MMARKQLIRALPAEWPVSITQVSNGEEAMQVLRQGLVEVMLLDLTMPVMDGFEVLAALRDGHPLQGHCGVRRRAGRSHPPGQ